MNRKTVLATAALIVCSVTALAGESEGVLVRSRAAVRPRVSEDARAVQACAEAFFNRILPASQAKLTVRMPGDGQVFGATGSVIGPLIASMDVTMTARAADTGSLLATSFCTVGRDGKVFYQTYKIKDETRLASLRPALIRLAVNLR